MRSRVLVLIYLATLVFAVASVRLASHAPTVRVAAAQPPTEPKELPNGLYCNPKGIVASNGLVIDPARKCSCKHMTHSHDCEGDVEEHSNCAQYCHKDHCHCPVVCDPSDDVNG